MSIAAAQASTFYEQVAREGVVFTFADDGSLLVFPNGGPAPLVVAAAAPRGRTVLV
jgi:hypothetical protein